MSAYINLFLISFLAGSFVPLGSEFYFLYLQNEGVPLMAILLISSMGNTLGGMTCYWLTRSRGLRVAVRLLRLDFDKLVLWHKKIEQKWEGKCEWLALLTWLPFIGELLAAVLGISTRKWSRVMLFMYIGKFFRYALLAGALEAYLT